MFMFYIMTFAQSLVCEGFLHYTFMPEPPNVLFIRRDDDPSAVKQSKHVRCKSKSKHFLLNTNCGL